MGDSVEIVNLLKELEIQVAGASAPETVRQAPSFTVSLVISMELAIFDEGIPKFLRGLAWIRLIKLWASLRVSDVQWVSPASLKIDHLGLSGVLSRTKTTGMGKKMFSQPFFVSAGSWITNGPVPCPSSDRTGVR
jgi:hypothetical protein